ncbi:MAG: gliding motility-associated C-terminal domain-containing protein [Bacteroidia bacterium]|nr:gliding motility-associated C-terminal domain-containing protein [Bacteroidia bacterium]
MKKFLLVLINLAVFFFSALATHNRAGEITYRQIPGLGLTYEFTVITYTFTLSPADRPELEIQWGDNTQSIIHRTEMVFLPNNYKRNTYVGRHTFPGAGTYVIEVEDPNRNYGVQNIPNSVNVVFAIKTIMCISPDIGFNNTPILTTPPIDKAAVGRLFIHNPGAYDPDGDSLSYKLTSCLGENGEVISGYTIPEASNAFYINEVTGDLIWDTPVKYGIYNVAIFIEEWRKGSRIGKIERDMQIEVYDVNNHPPVINVNDKYCVEADSVLRFDVTATDPENEVITLSAMGGPFLVPDNPAIFHQGISDTGFVSTPFIWATNCGNVRKQPYQVIFKAQDNNPILDLVDQKNVNIYVICPSPKNVVLTPTNNSITVHWEPSVCNNVKGYRIFRREGPSGFIPDRCETGVPESTGYVKIGEIIGLYYTTYLDNNNGLGLAQGYEYCYMIAAFFADEAEGYASTEVCTDLVRGIPVITNVSVNYTDSINGSVYVAWAKPTELDTLPSHPHGPYKYFVYHSNDLWGEKFVLIDSLTGLDDTTFVDTLLNTRYYPWSYKIELYNDSTGKRFLIGSPSIASSVFLKITPADNKLTIDFEKNVPWHNNQYVIYRQNDSLAFDSLNSTTSEGYIDSMLTNGKNYCYLIKSIGGYSLPGFVYPIINYSEIQCAAPLDTVPSCSPQFTVLSNCDSLRNQLSWTNPNLSCSNDVVKYNIYYSPTIDGARQLIATVMPAEITAYYHYPSVSMAGCYYVTAVDSFNNESRNPVKVCIDSCIYYKLPNIFTPDGDGTNDLFKPINKHFVDKIDLKIYDRWGMLVYKTDNPDINWDGKHIEKHKLVPSGVYYYVCDVYEYRLTGLEPRTLLGFIHVIGTETGTKK